jgi:hypothetical protein
LTRHVFSFFSLTRHAFYSFPLTKYVLSFSIHQICFVIFSIDQILKSLSIECYVMYFFVVVFFTLLLLVLFYKSVIRGRLFTFKVTN